MKMLVAADLKQIGKERQAGEQDSENGKRCFSAQSGLIVIYMS